jgi:hypothetical protein
VVKRFDRDDPVASFKAVLRDLIKGYEFDVTGLYLKDGSIRPLPCVSWVVGRVLEVSLKEYLHRKLLQMQDLTWIAGGVRTYPDLTFNGPWIAPNRFAVDVKCARRAEHGKRTRSTITIGTFDADYYRHAEQPAPNITVPYASYTAHLALIALYDYAEATARNVELLVVEKWRVATRRRSIGTRCYIATVSDIAKLRAEQGDFASEADFNTFWRSQPIGATKQNRPAE